MNVFGFSGVGLEVWAVAAAFLVLLVLALLAASANVFFRSVAHFEDDVREATMNYTPELRRRFYALYAAEKPRDAAVAWFLAVGLGPIGVNFYRGKPYACAAALLSLNGLGAWWLESCFTAPQFVLIENRNILLAVRTMLEQEVRRAEREKAEAIA